MAFGWEERPRLLREESWTAPALAQEIYASLSPDAPTSTNGPVQINQSNPNASVAPLTIGNASNSGPAITINRQDGITINFNGDGTITSQSDDGGQQQVNGGGGGRGSSGGQVIPVWG